MKKRKNPAVELVPSQTQELLKRIEALEAYSAARIEYLEKKVNFLSHAIKANFVETKSHKDLINDLGLDVPERLRPRR